MEEVQNTVQQEVNVETGVETTEVKVEETPVATDPVATEETPKTEEAPKAEETVVAEETPKTEEVKPTEDPVATEAPKSDEPETVDAPPAENFEEKYNALQSEFSAQAETILALQDTISALTAERDSLAAFKLEVEDAKKDEMIGNFYMLSDEDKKDVIDHKSEYSVAEIEEKLSVICYRKKVNFGTEINSNFNNKTEEETPAVTYTVENEYSSIPAWIQAVKENSK